MARSSRTRSAPRKAPATARRPQPPAGLVTIDRLGLQGDGLGRWADGSPAYLPGALAGEIVQATPLTVRGDGWAGRIDRIEQASPDRQAAACQHFLQCGGCVAQHLAPSAYAEWKLSRLTLALSRQNALPPGGKLTSADLVISPPGGRRRLTLAGLRTAGGVLLGFNAFHSDRLIDLAECPVADPRLLTLLPALRALLTDLLPLRGQVDLSMTWLSGGVDLLVRGGPVLDLAAREKLVAFAETTDLARLSWQAAGQGIEPVAERRRPLLALPGAKAECGVGVPPGAFLQATPQGEAALLAAVLAALPERGRVADLFAGCGTFALPVASRGHAVVAVEGDAGVLAALDRAARAGSLAVQCQTRDLAKRPLESDELAGFAAVILDPPRGGGGGTNGDFGAFDRAPDHFCVVQSRQLCPRCRAIAGWWLSLEPSGGRRSVFMVAAPGSGRGV